jgi:choice-of-anchor B domain-containing protein
MTKFSRSALTLFLSLSSYGAIAHTAPDKLNFASTIKNSPTAFKSLKQAQTQQNCVNGKAENFACNNMDLLAHIPLASFSNSPDSGNDVWGHVDLNSGNEYAIIGLNNGVAIINVTDPVNPVEIGIISGANSWWRDIKVYQYYDENLGLWQAYAYTTIDSAADKVSIIDLNDLPNSVSLVEKDNVVATAHNVYISNIDHTLNITLPGLTASLQLMGTNKNSGAFTNYSLADPKTITELTGLNKGQGYTHDGASLVIDDERKNSICPSTANCTIFVDFNEKDMKLWDISDPQKTALVGTGIYTDVSSINQYVHSGWPSEDKQYIFAHDEFDEEKAGINTTVRVFAIADLNNPQHVGQWTGTTAAIDHNGFVRGNRYYMTNYERGLTVLDISDPVYPIEVGYFDTFTPSNNADFNGAWGAYPFLPSGNILVSDFNSGLYILRDNTLTSAQGTINFTAKEVSIEQGNELTINTQRQNAQSDASTISVGYELLSGSAKQNEDYIPVSGRLTWADNDSTNKSITISIPDNNTGNELAESFFVRLFDPKNGATLSSPSYLKVNITGIANTGIVNFVQESITLNENQQSASIEVSRSGSSTGDISVTYTLASGSAEIGSDIVDNSGQLNWADGDSENKVIELTLINDDLAEANEYFTVNLASVNSSRLGNNAQLTATITDDDNNTAPTVELGENKQVNSGQSVNLTATANDAENDAITYAWTQTSGTSVTLSATDTASINFTAPSTAVDLVFSVTVTDSRGLASTDTITISVIVPPVVLPPVTTKSGGGSSSYIILLILFLGLIRIVRKKSKKRKII